MHAVIGRGRLLRNLQGVDLLDGDCRIRWHRAGLAKQSGYTVFVLDLPPDSALFTRGLRLGNTGLYLVITPQCCTPLSNFEGLPGYGGIKKAEMTISLDAGEVV